MRQASTNIPADYSVRVRSVRGRLELTQAQLAERIGVSFATVNRWENAQSKPTRLAWHQILGLEAGIGAPGKRVEITGAPGLASSRRMLRNSAWSPFVWRSHMASAVKRFSAEPSKNFALPLSPPDLSTSASPTLTASPAKSGPRIELQQRIPSGACQMRQLVGEHAEGIEHDDGAEARALIGRDRRKLALGIDDDQRTRQMRDVRHDQAGATEVRRVFDT
jgi:DNA-binding XRE family transcriptional regulator